MSRFGIFLKPHHHSHLDTEVSFKYIHPQSKTLFNIESYDRYCHSSQTQTNLFTTPSLQVCQGHSKTKSLTIIYVILKKLYWGQNKLHHINFWSVKNLKKERNPYNAYMYYLRGQKTTVLMQAVVLAYAIIPCGLYLRQVSIQERVMMVQLN